MSQPDDTILHQGDVEDVIEEHVLEVYPKLDDSATSTTTALAAIGNAVNTSGKYAGKMVFNTTTGKPVWAVGPLAGDVWKDATATTAHTPV